MRESDLADCERGSVYSPKSPEQRKPERDGAGALIFRREATGDGSGVSGRPRGADSEAAQLRLALQQAEAERDSARAFLSYMSHELRSPLTAITGMADLVLDTQLTPDQREMLGILQRGGQSLVGILSNVLDLSKLDAGMLQLELRPFEFRACLEECLELLSGTALQKGIELAYAVDEATPGRLLGDAGRLRQVLMNVLGNAIKFTDTGHVVVAVTTRRLPDGLAELHVAVSDTGPGIPADRLEAIFGEFTQADASTAGRYGGSGLGLSISQRLVEIMGGRIWAESDGRRGTTFHFTLAARSADTPETLLPGRQPVLLGKRVLALHDTATVGWMLTEQLGRWGIQAHLTTQAADVLDWLRAGERYDMILINHQVAGMDGRSLASAIRAVPGAGAVPLVLLTSLGVDGRQKGPAGSADGTRFAAYLAKPVKHARLHELLMRTFAVDATACATEAALPAPATTAQVDDSETGPATERERGPTANLGGFGLAGARILVADDDPAIRRTLERLLRSAGTEVVTVADGRAALEEFICFDPDVVLLDVTMPEMDGFETCRRLKGDPDTRLTPVVLLTGLDRDADRLRGIEAGADDIVLKPFEWRELLARVRVLTDRKRFTDGLDRAEAALVTMARCIELRDPDTHGHCDRLSGYASRLGERLGLDVATINALRLGGIIHDIGKVAVPDAILFKPGPLTDEEWAIMRMHPIEGERICAGLNAFRRVLPIIRHHHERMDGSGYPDGLRGEDIPVSARVLQTVDIYDALTTNRPYKPAMSTTRALEIMQEEADRGWRDPHILEAFRSMLLQDLERTEGPVFAQAG
jgi:response regulator RpfG family c-di-GMP phosphodiesterase/signal transduction histidine kinase